MSVCVCVMMVFWTPSSLSLVGGLVNRPSASRDTGGPQVMMASFTARYAKKNILFSTTNRFLDTMLAKIFVLSFFAGTRLYQELFGYVSQCFPGTLAIYTCSHRQNPRSSKPPPHSLPPSKNYVHAENKIKSPHLLFLDNCAPKSADIGPGLGADNLPRSLSYLPLLQLGIWKPLRQPRAYPIRPWYTKTKNQNFKSNN